MFQDELVQMLLASATDADTDIQYQKALSEFLERNSEKTGITISDLLDDKNIEDKLKL